MTLVFAQIAVAEQAACGGYIRIQGAFYPKSTVFHGEVELVCPRDLKPEFID